MVRVSLVGGLLLLLVLTGLKGQNPKIDSLKEAVKHASTPNQQSDVLHELASELWDYDFEKAKSYATQALDIARQNSYRLGQVQALTDLGMYSYFVGDYPQARTYYDDALRVADNENFGNYPSYTYTRLGNLFRVQSAFDSAKFYYQKSLHLVEHEDSYPMAASSSRYNLGLLNIELADYREALMNINRALQLREQIGDSLLMAECWKSLGVAYKSLSEYKPANENYQRAMNVAIQFKNPELEMFCSIQIGELAFLEGNSEKAIQLFSSALEILKKHNFKRYYALALQHIGRVFVAHGDYEKALEFYFDALKLSEELGARQESARTNVIIGWVYTYQRNFGLAFEYANRSLTEMRKIRDREGISLAENLIGQIHFRQQRYDSALVHYERSLQLRKEIGSPIAIANATFNIAGVYEAKGDLNRALTYLLEAVKFHQRFSIELATDYNGVGELLIKMRKFELAEEYLVKAKKLAEEFTLRPEIRDNYRHMASLARSKGDYKGALTYYDRFITLDDSLTNETGASRVAQLNALYQLEKKEREIQNLSQENVAKQNQIEVQSSKIKFQNAVLIFSILALLLLAVVAVVLYRYYRSKIIANLELSRLNREVHEQYEEIQSQSEELSEAYQTISEINKGLEKKIDERTSALRQAYKELDTFFYRSSHDFRRPLTTFQGLAEVAKVTLKDAAAIELFDKVNETARGVDRMLVKLQSVSLIASSELAYEEVQFETELDFIFEQFRTTILQRKIKIKRELALSIPFRSYPALIRITLENLIENAIQFMGPTDPSITVRIARDSQTIVIAVSDNGEGIAKEFHNRIFDMYFRANDKSRGNGLGLYIVRKAVEKLRGSLTFESSYGEGSTFTVTLPDLG